MDEQNAGASSRENAEPKLVARPKPAADPHYALMLEESARDRQRFREQLAKLRLACGVLLVIFGTGVATSAVVSYAAGLRATATVASPGTRLIFLGATLGFAMVLFGFGLWLAIKAYTD